MRFATHYEKRHRYYLALSSGRLYCCLRGGLVGEAIFGTILAPKKEDVIIFLLLYLCAVVVFCTGLILSKGTGDKVSAEREEKPGPEKSPENNE